MEDDAKSAYGLNLISPRKNALASSRNFGLRNDESKFYKSSKDDDERTQKGNSNL
jgi:hypothetical protein